MDNRQRALNYLGLARRGGNIAIGEEPVGIACRGSHARLLILAQDAADNTFRRARSFAAGGKPPIIRVPYTKVELGDALGVNACAILALTDVQLALAFVKALDQPQTYQAALDSLEKRAKRIRQRQQEAKAHARNKAMGYKGKAKKEH